MRKRETILRPWIKKIKWISAEYYGGEEGGKVESKTNICEQGQRGPPGQPGTRGLFKLLFPTSYFWFYSIVFLFETFLILKLHFRLY